VVCLLTFWGEIIPVTYHDLFYKQKNCQIEKNNKDITKLTPKEVTKKLKQRKKKTSKFKFDQPENNDTNRNDIPKLQTTEQQTMKGKCNDNGNQWDPKHECLEYSKINAALKEVYLQKDGNAPFNLRDETIPRPRPLSFLDDKRNIIQKKHELEHFLKQFSLKQFFKDTINCCSKKKGKIIMKLEMFLKKFYSKIRGICNKKYLREEKK
jgi:hypothetical protein